MTEAARAAPRLRVGLVTIMPAMLGALREDGVVGGAIRAGLVELLHVNPRDFTTDRHATVDDAPYGGGPGMVLKPEPLVQAIRHARTLLPRAKVRCLAVDGVRFDDRLARRLAAEDELLFVCGRYQGIDERVLVSAVDSLVSLGDFVTSGGELPAMVMVDAIARHVPGVLGSPDSAALDSLADGMLAAPCYTRPADYDGQRVPAVLLSGDHGRIKCWRADAARARTAAWQARRRGDASLAEGV